MYCQLLCQQKQIKNTNMKFITITLGCTIMVLGSTTTAPCPQGYVQYKAGSNQCFESCGQFGYWSVDAQECQCIVDAEKNDDNICQLVTEEQTAEQSTDECGINEVQLGGTCVCQDGYVKYDGENCQKFCGVHGYWDIEEQACVCTIDAQLNSDGVCEIQPPSGDDETPADEQSSVECEKDNQQQVNGICQCIQGYHLYDGQNCHKICENGYWGGSDCVCNYGYHVVEDSVCAKNAY